MEVGPGTGGNAERMSLSPAMVSEEHKASILQPDRHSWVYILGPPLSSSGVL